MQARIGTKRYLRGLYSYVQKAAAGIFSCGLVFFFTSCSLLKQDASLRPITKSLDGICLTSSGKGRIELERGRHLFNYESLIREDKKTWSLGLNLPVIGQEVLELDVPNEIDQKYKVRGTFARRLEHEITSRRDRILLAKFFQRLSEFVWVVRNKNIEKAQSNEWVISHKGDDLLGEAKVSNKFSFRFKAFSYNATSNSYGRIELSLVRNRDNASMRNINGFNKDYIKLDLFVSDCGL